MYRVWQAIKNRCLNPNVAAWKDYGGRGITVCARWKSSYEHFIADIGDRPPGRTIDRVDNNGGYWCGHCDECIALSRPPNWRWATIQEQTANTRANHLLTHDGITLPLCEWARRVNINAMVLRMRLVTYGWTVERTLTTPLHWRGRPHLRPTRSDGRDTRP